VIFHYKGLFPGPKNSSKYYPLIFKFRRPAPSSKTLVSWDFWSNCFWPFLLYWEAVSKARGRRLVGEGSGEQEKFS